MVALSVYHASNVRVDARNSSCFVLQLQSVVYLKQWLSNRQRSWTLARIVTITVQLWLQLLSSYAQQNSSILYLAIIESVSATCSTPCLNLSSEPRPSWNNIQDTFLTGVRNGYNSTSICTHNLTCNTSCSASAAITPSWLYFFSKDFNCVSLSFFNGATSLAGSSFKTASSSVLRTSNFSWCPNNSLGQEGSAQPLDGGV